MAPLPAVDRLVFLGLISMADDYGRVHDNIKVIDAFIFPETDETVRESLANLSRIGRVVRGSSSSGMRILQIANWDKHQKVDKPQPQKALPKIELIPVKTEEITTKSDSKEAFANDSRTIREKVAPLIPDPRSPIGDLRSPITDLGSSLCSEPENPASEPEPPDPSECEFPTFPTSGKPYTWQATAKELARWQSSYPAVDIEHHHQRAHTWIMANLTKRKTAKGYSKFLNQWFAKEQDKPGQGGSNGQPHKTFAQQRVENSKAVAEKMMNLDLSRFGIE